MSDNLRHYPACKTSGVPWLGDSPSSVKIGYKISFTRHLYKPWPLWSLEEIRAGILALKRETEGPLAEIVQSFGRVSVL